MVDIANHETGMPHSPGVASEAPVAIRLEFYNLIIPIRVIDRKYPGGWDRCRKDHGLRREASSFGSCCHDGELFRDGAMDPLGFALLLDRWTSLGFKSTRSHRNRKVAADVCLYATFADTPEHPCDWVRIDTENGVAELLPRSRGSCQENYWMTRTEASEKLAAIAKKISLGKADYLEALKADYVNLRREDFLWHFLLQSFATMGRSSGWHGLIGNKANYDRVTFEALDRLTPDARETTLKSVCREAKVRMPDRKAAFLLGCFERINMLGGPLAARDKLLALPGRDAKIRFLKQFPGIGPKYARNIMMDVYHEDFRDSIAVDARIKSILSALGLSLGSYTEEEEFFLGVARSAGLNGWELDRLMYHFKDEFEAAIQEWSQPLPADV